MKVLTISYKQKFPTGSYLNCDIGFEASIGENEKPEDAMKTLQDLAESFHKSSFSHLYTESGKPITITQVEEDRRVGMVEAIETCTDLGVLKTFALLAKGNPDHKAAYDKRFLELSK